MVVVLFAAMTLLIACSPSQPAPAQQAEPAAAVAPVEVNAKLAPQEYQEQFVASGAQHQLIDVRTPEEFASGHIQGAVNIPVQELPQRLSEISMDEPVVLYCRSGNRSAQAAQILDEANYLQVYDLGGIAAWHQAGLPIE
jgi:rhodanese-related sulfurtransferase